MRLPIPIRLLLSVGLCGSEGMGWLTLSNIAEITNLSVQGRERIVDGKGMFRFNLGGKDVMMINEGMGAFRERGREDIESDVTVALNTLNQVILGYLNTPNLTAIAATATSRRNRINKWKNGKKVAPSPVPKPPPCKEVKNDFHEFLKHTTLFLRAIEDTITYWGWEAKGPVCDSLGYYQALWASRRPNEQDRSFIEQQMTLYNETGCFVKEEGKGDEVLRRDVEVVEYINDLLEKFK